MFSPRLGPLALTLALLSGCNGGEGETGADAMAASTTNDAASAGDGSLDPLEAALPEPVELDGARPQDDAAVELDASAEDAAQDVSASDAAGEDASAVDAGSLDGSASASDAATADAASGDATVADAASGDAAVADAASGDASLPDAAGGDAAVPDWASAAWPAASCEWVLTIGAHGTAGTPLAQDSTGFPVPTTQYTNRCFWEKVPWGNTKVQVLATRARVDGVEDQALVQRIVVGGLQPGMQSIAGARPNGPGDHKACDNTSGTTLGMWARGLPTTVTLPGDVGLFAPSGDSYIEMQVQYRNPSHTAGAQSRVQFELCATSQLRPQTAGVFTLGYENATAQTFAGFETLIQLGNQADGSAIGKCTSKTKGHILSVVPYLQARGTRTKLEIVRKDGPTQLLFDEPFVYPQYRVFYPQNAALDQGETVRSTCRWNTKPVSFGVGTEHEQCFFYTLAYPVELFWPNAFERGIIGGSLACAAAAGP